MGGEAIPVPIPVMADAQFGLVRSLIPYNGFDTDYAGNPADVPIMFTEGGEALDPRAGQQGYDSNLIRGLSVPEGARVLIWVPQITYDDGAQRVPYTWSFWWRYRTLRDYRLDRSVPYHLAESTGQPDTSGGTPQERVLIPAANSSTIYVQTEPASPFARVTQNGRSEDIRFGSPNLARPLVPGGAAGVVQQGVKDPAIFADAADPLYILHEVSATGDELLIGCSRANVPDWDFSGGGADEELGNLLGATGSATAAVYVSLGTSP